MMKKIELFSGEKYVATVEVLPGVPTETVIWGNRVFTRKGGLDTYHETSVTISLTPSPGLERQPRCSESVREFEYRRPCELAEGHEGGHRYTVVTHENKEQLRIPPEPVNRENITTLHGTPVEKVREDHAKQPTGMHDDYIVLNKEEREKGFVRPVRDSYKHVGIPAPKNPLRDLTAEEHERYDKYGYVKFEKYPEGHHTHGRFWTQAQLDSIDKGCQATTVMSRELAETYAREPTFYGATYCCRCGTHFPVGEFGEFVWAGTNERVGT